MEPVMAVDIQQFFNNALPEGLERNRDEAKKYGGILQFDITGEGGGSWLVNVSDSGPSVTSGQGTAHATIIIAAEDFQKLYEDSKNYMLLFHSGKMKIIGNEALAMKLDRIFKFGR
jgi:putative sterol carrier protein